MPIYDFKCEKCEYKVRTSLTISLFNTYKNIMECEKCNEGLLVQIISRVNGMIDRNSEQLSVIASEEAATIIKKVKSGDERTIRDVYGENKNQLK